MMKKEFEKYLSKWYPTSKIDSPFSLGGEVHIRFELGGELLENGTKERVKQAVERAERIFHSTFPNLDQEVFLIIYEFNDDPYARDKRYIYTLIAEKQYETFFNEPASINVGDQQHEEWEDGRIVIGRVKLTDIKIKDILAGIANLDMGFEPAIPQQVYFFDMDSSKGFYMYDDRGCFVFSDDAEKIRNIYEELNEWIVDYHRPEIDTFFQ